MSVLLVSTSNGRIVETSDGYAGYHAEGFDPVQYAVPEWLEMMIGEGLQDLSWHNDESPSFGLERSSRPIEDGSGPVRSVRASLFVGRLRGPSRVQFDGLCVCGEDPTLCDDVECADVETIDEWNEPGRWTIHTYADSSDDPNDYVDEWTELPRDATDDDVRAALETAIRWALQRLTE